MRKANDDYPSESAMVSQLLARQRVSGTVLEPCAGSGQLASPLRQAGLQVITNDINKNYNTVYHFDATDRELWCVHHNWVITNPPYTSEALEVIMEYALASATSGVAMLLRLTANEPVIKRGFRGELLQQYEDNLRYLITFSAPRPSFTGNGKTDSVTTAWFVWDKGFSWKQIGLRPPFQYAVNWRQNV